MVVLQIYIVHNDPIFMSSDDCTQFLEALCTVELLLFVFSFPSPSSCFGFCNLSPFLSFPLFLVLHKYRPIRIDYIFFF